MPSIYHVPRSFAVLLLFSLANVLSVTPYYAKPLSETENTASPFVSLNKLAAPPPDQWPSVGAGLGGVNFFSTYSPFTDAIKSARWSNVASWDGKGYPASAAAGQAATARAGVDNGDNWPTGRYTLTWEGEGDVIVTAPYEVELISESLDGPVKQRVYAFDPTDFGIQVRVESFPATNIHLYLPGLSEHSSLWNPAYLEYLNPLKGKLFRHMDLGETNSSEQVNWSDRTPRDWSTYTNRNQEAADWKVKGAVSWEAMIELSNELEADMWINVPHQATDDYVRKLAHLIKTGVDLATGEQTTEPLDADLRVFLEYSNEVWNFGPGFRQTNWVNENVAGENLDEKYVKKAVSVFSTFKGVFQADQRLVRVLCTQTTNGEGIYSRTYRRLAAARYGEDYDAVGVTTYFSYDYHQYLYDNWPVSATQLGNHLQAQIGTGAFRESDLNITNERVYWSYWAAEQFGVPVISYEGNEHLNSVRSVDTNNDGETDTQLVEAIPEALEVIQQLARSEQMADMLEAYQRRCEASGLRMFNAFVLLNGWSKFGQWGFAEYVGQPVAEAVKYRWLLEYFGLPFPGVSDPNPDPAEANTSITVYAAGRLNSESMELKIDGQAVKTWSNVGGNPGQSDFVAYRYTANKEVSAAQIRVALPAGSQGDLRIDKIEVNGTAYESEAATTYSTGTWLSADNPCSQAGFKRSEWLGCDGGYLAYDYRSANARTATFSRRPDLSPETLLLYPNPAQETTQLRWYNQQAGKVDVQVSNTLGQVVWRHTESTRPGNHHLDIPTDKLQGGTYFVMLRYKDQQATQRLIIQ